MLVETRLETEIAISCGKGVGLPLLGTCHLKCILEILESLLEQLVNREQACYKNDMDKMILYLDDWRWPPEGSEYRSATNYQDFIMLIDTYRDCLEQVDLDYDLGYDSKWSGLDVLKYMKQFNVNCPHINIHSTHPSGREMMIIYATANFPDSVVTTWS